MSTDAGSSLPADDLPPGNGDGSGGNRIVDQTIESELKQSYLTYAMSVIVSRALPDVRDGLKPSQRRILVAMSDLNLSPGASTTKCAAIVGETMKTYHPHGDMAIYPTLVRLAQEWNTRYTLIDKQGNFGNVAGMPPAAMRYTEARLSSIGAMMLDDVAMNTVDYIPTYDEKSSEPSVLPSKFPNLLVNGSLGIAVGMATSIPPHNLREVCDALVKVIEEPYISIEELMKIIPGPDFPTGGMICGRAGIRRSYLTGRGNVVLRARAEIVEMKNNRHKIIFREIPYQQVRDNVLKKISDLVNDERIKDISAITDLSDLKEPVRIDIELKKGADPDVVLAQLYQFSPLQDTFSIINLALVDGKPRELSLKQLLEEFLRHRVIVIRRRTQFQLSKARKRKHTIEGLLLALANIDEIIRIIRKSRTQAEAKASLMGVECPASMMKQALGENGFRNFQLERGEADAYGLTAVQAEAILRMTLGQLVNLEQERLGGEHAELLKEIEEYLRILSDDANIREIIKADLIELRRKHGDDRRTEISPMELGNVNIEDLITEETMVVSISHKGYIKRTAASTYRAQKRGGKGLKGAKTDEEDPIAHLFVASTHAYLLFFTNLGKVFWQKVYDLPELSRESRGRAIVNLLNLADGEKVAQCIAIRDFNLPGHFLMMATRAGLVKKTKLEDYSRPKKGGLIAIKLREGDELMDVVVTKPGDELILATEKGMAIRFAQTDARPMGRNTSGVKGISLGKEDKLVGMVVADPEATLLTVCENGYGKRTPFGPNSPAVAEAAESETAEGDVPEDDNLPDSPPVDDTAGEEEDDAVSGQRYRTQRRGGKGLRDIKATKRNGKVIGIIRVDDTDEVLMMTARGKLQKIAATDINVIGRNTQGVRVMSLDDEDTLVAIERVPYEEATVAEAAAAEVAASEATKQPPPVSDAIDDDAPAVDEATDENE